MANRASARLSSRLPLKVLAWQDASGKVWLGYTDPTYFARRYGLTEAQVAPIAGVAQLVACLTAS